jgi:hypothetical protein
MDGKLDIDELEGPKSGFGSWDVSDVLGGKAGSLATSDDGGGHGTWARVSSWHINGTGRISDHKISSLSTGKRDELHTHCGFFPPLKHFYCYYLSQLVIPYELHRCRLHHGHHGLSTRCIA